MLRKVTETAPARFPCLSYAMKQPTPREGTEIFLSRYGFVDVP